MMTPLPRLLGAAASLFVLLASPLAAQPQRAPEKAPLRAARAGEPIEAAGSSRRAELLDLEEGLAPGLLQVRPEETVKIDDWPLAPELRGRVALTRHEIYAPDAKIFVIDGPGKREIPRSKLAFFWGTAEDDPEARVFVALDPDTGALDGFTQTREGLHEIHPLKKAIGEKAARGSRQHVVAEPAVFLGEGEKPPFNCDQNSVPLDFLAEGLASAQEPAVEPLFAAAITSLHTIIIGVDTDNELMLNKFGNNTTAANNYIASLIAAMSAIYERDLLVRLVQGTTYLRVSTTPDPYVSNASGNADSSKLNEFSNYWNTNYGTVDRGLAMMLSGKQTNGGASGIAWVGSLCSKSTGYSFSQVYVSGTAPSSGDILVVAHEIGHNFGSPHTHCYSTPVDFCYNAQSGCYSGTKSCPAATTMNGVTSVTGTLMSYCHLSGLAGCTSKAVFHPRSVELLNPLVQSRVGVCINPAGISTAPTITLIRPNSGSTAGGTAVTITGTNFRAGASVTFGGSAATSVTVVNATTITAVTPARATGRVNVAVTNSDATSATLANGYFYAPPPAPANFYSVTPCRLIDTRNAVGILGGPALSGGQQRTFTLTGACGVPAGAKAVSVNLTVTGPTAGGGLAIYPGNAFPLGTSSINFGAGQTRANNSILTLATDGTGTVGVHNAAGGSTHFILDVNGYYQ